MKIEATLATFPLTDGREYRVIEMGLVDADLNPTRGLFAVLEVATDGTMRRVTDAHRRADYAMADGLQLAGWDSVQGAFDDTLVKS